MYVHPCYQVAVFALVLIVLFRRCACSHALATGKLYLPAFYLQHPLSHLSGLDLKDTISFFGETLRIGSVPNICMYS